MIPHSQSVGDYGKLGFLTTPIRRISPAEHPLLCRLSPDKRRTTPLAVAAGADDLQEPRRIIAGKRREFVLLSSLVSTARILGFTGALRAEEKVSDALSSSNIVEEKKEEEEEEKKEEENDSFLSRVYDATVIGEPRAVGKDKKKVWDKLLGARVVYLGEAEQVPDRDDRVLELEIVKNLSTRCSELQRPISLAIEAFPYDLQEQLNQFMEGRIDGERLSSYTSHWPPGRWQDYEPLLNFCRDNCIKLVACGTPLEVIDNIEYSYEHNVEISFRKSEKVAFTFSRVLRIVQAEGIRGLSKAQHKLFAPPVGSGFISGFTSISGRSMIDKLSSKQPVSFGPSSYLSAQARVVDDYTMSQSIIKAIVDGGSSGLLVVVTGASHVIYGSRGTGVPARISRKLQMKNQMVILLDPERQDIRREGEVPMADFLWYSAAKPCSRNCFDRAEIARVMNAAGRGQESLPQDLQKGLDLGVVSPEILQNFFDLEQYPVIAELIHRFKGFRERLLADPKFLHRLAIEETISITTTLLAQYERRKGHFSEEIDYVLTDTIRGSVVDFFTVWLPAPTLSFLVQGEDGSPMDNLELLKGFIGSLPDNAFQKNIVGKDWTANQRLASMFFGGMKLAGVGFISSVGAGAASDFLYAIRRYIKGSFSIAEKRKRSPILKSAVAYGCFLGTSANLRYQQWVDLARFTGLQPQKNYVNYDEIPKSSDLPLLECNSSTNLKAVEESSIQSGDSSA
ncbi:hypothetical protein AXF42_Ash013796 [Apostasia shenzhenica]|uniref:Haem-binding uptake Tiki superfamily ChaN domain-containing protein n=1 Tax=Apostasia shenzhenica TaxID=1088818 RepID=A0A2I0A4W9_9ASPA|nr:hypothetical protein AXF42_Ash013796 [Apostasia shenzhenica]